MKRDSKYLILTISNVKMSGIGIFAVNIHRECLKYFFVIIN